MEYASAPRKTTAKKNTKTKKEKVKASDIRILPIDKSRSFSEEIPEQLKYKNYLSKLMFWSKTSRDRWSWDKIPKDAKNLDKEIVERKAGHPLVFTDKVNKVAERLKRDSIEYIDKNESYIGDDLEYAGEDEAKAIISKRSLVARKMVNKVVYELEDSGSFNGKDENGNGIKEGAQNVNLELGRESAKRSPDYDPKEDKVIKNKFLKYMDCRHKKLFEHEPTASDCRQQGLGDCWLQAVLIDILTKKGSQPIKDMFKDEGDSGYVRIRLYYPKDRTDDNGDEIDDYNWRWEPKYYRVPKKIPVIRVFNNITIYNSGANWVHYLQAAVAKSGIRDKALGDDRTLKDPATGQKTRDYASNDGGCSWIAWAMILGDSIEENYFGKEYLSQAVTNYKDALDENALEYATKKVKADIAAGTLRLEAQAMLEKTEQYKEEYKKQNNGQFNESDKLYDTIKKEADAGKFMTISFDQDTLKRHDRKVGFSGGEGMDRGLVTNHVYAVIGVEEIDGVKYIRLINPWHDRIGRKYINYINGKKADKGKKRKASFKGKGDESFLLKATTAYRHLQDLEIGDV